MINTRELKKIAHQDQNIIVRVCFDQPGDNEIDQQFCLGSFSSLFRRLSIDKIISYKNKPILLYCDVPLGRGGYQRGNPV